MKRDGLLIYGDRVPLPFVLEHERFRSYRKTGLELRRAAARALNRAMVEAGLTRGEVASLLGIPLEALSDICNARHSMDLELLQRALRRLERDWRETTVYFAEAIDYRRAPRIAGHA
jgi:hypothetical protein